MANEMEECINKMCGLLLLKCVEEETLHIGLDVDYKNSGLNCRLKCEFEVINEEVKE